MEAAEGAWQPLLDQKGKPADQESFRSVHCIGDYEQVFTVVLQRQAKRGQKELDLEDDTEQAPVDDGFETVNYVYHAIGSRGATTEPRLDRQGRPPPGGPMAQNKVDSTPPPIIIELINCMADMANTINHQEARMNHEHHDVKDEVKQTGPKQTAPKKLWVTPSPDYA